MPKGGSYLTFNLVPVVVNGEVVQRKTNVWSVDSTSRVYLGLVKWYPSWWCYCFFPTEGALFNSSCLFDVAQFCKTRTDEHAMQLRGKKAAKNG